MGKKILLLSICISLVSIQLGACGVLPSMPTSPTAGECAAGATPLPNLYDIKPEHWVLEVYEHANLEANPMPGLEYKAARSAAFKILGHQTQRWSDFVDLRVNETENVRITVIYLSPQLIETILLNDVLLHWFELERPVNFADILHGGLAKSQERNEVLFLIIISTTQYRDGTNGEPVSVEIPLKNFNLTNSTNTSVATKRDDDSLNQQIRLSHGAFAALVSFQMTVQNGKTCALLLDPRENNIISLHLEGLKINSMDQGAQTWTIRYESLLGGTGPGIRPDYTYTLDPALPAPLHWSPSQDAPTPLTGVPTSATALWDEYWQKMGCFIWEQATFANSP